MAYHLAPSLATLRSQINAAWPHRDKASDGWIGDASHQASKSDHNPDYSAGGVVRAIDIDRDGIDVDAVLAAVLADRRTCYVIWNRHLWAHDTRAWRAYTGTNPHTQHIHISIRHGRTYETDTGPWPLHTESHASGTGPATPTPAPPPEEDDTMPIYIQQIDDTAKAVLALNPATGRVRAVPQEEWTILRAMQTGAKPVLPLVVHQVAKHYYDRVAALPRI